MVGRPTVLVIEDDIKLAEITCEVIESAGLQAVFRTTLADALDYLGKNTGTTIALVTDVNLMSPMGGIELAVYVAEEWPSVAICVTSGMSLDRPSRLPTGASFLAKPWQANDLIDFVRAAHGLRPPS